jgi:hypothetical protein
MGRGRKTTAGADEAAAAEHEADLRRDRARLGLGRVDGVIPSRIGRSSRVGAGRFSVTINAHNVADQVAASFSFQVPPGASEAHGRPAPDGEWPKGAGRFA